MNFKERNYALLVVSASETFCSAIKEILAPYNGAFTARYEQNVAAAKRAAAETAFDLLIVNAPLPDEFGSKFAAEFASDKSGVALLVVRSEIYGDVYQKMVDNGVYVLPKPLNKYMMIRALEWMCATKERLRRLEKKAVSLEEKMEEIRLVNRAKWILIQHLKMNESDAHRYIEKRAMDTCVSRREIAENIIKTYT